MPPWLLIALAALGGLLFLAVLVALLALWRFRSATIEHADEDVGLEETEAVVLAHGLLGFESVGFGRARQRYFRGIREGLECAGVPTFVSAVAPLGSVPARASQLSTFINSLEHDHITVLAHSMGGLDARYAITKLGLHKRVRVLITIGTPHRGSPIADLAATKPARGVRALAQLLGLRSDAIDWLTTASLERFNRDVPDHPSVAYYSVVGRSAVRELWRNPALLGSHLFLRRSGGDNDGLVTVESQRWGETLEEIDANHFEQIGWSLRFRAAALYLRLLRKTKAKPLAPDASDRATEQARDQDQSAEFQQPRGL